MPQPSKEHEDFLLKAAGWIKAHGEKYCPVTAVKHLPRWKKLFKELEKWGLVQEYKRGETVIVTKAGWDYLAAKHPDLVRRRTGVIPIEKQ
ncbi:MAG: hypothetical protein QMD00_00330 [Hadesarchaea archaeon]|nr:hypothetical protein [Hadesarchaea archaeon]